MPLSALPRRWRTLLILSLGLNVLIGSLAIGTLVGREGGRGGRAEPLVWALPDTDRQALRDALPRTSREDRRARFETLLDAIRADPFEPDRLRALLSRQRALGAERAERAEAAVVRRLSQMSLEDRAAYADRLAHGVRMRAPRR